MTFVMWPSGRWPPEEELLGWGASETESGPDGDSSGSNRATTERPRVAADPRVDATMARAGSGGHKRQGRRPTAALPRAVYAPVVHCGSIRQAAAVLAMSEAPAMDDGDGALPSQDWLTQSRRVIRLHRRALLRPRNRAVCPFALASFPT